MMQSPTFAIDLLKELISRPSHSRDEGSVADFLCELFKEHGCTPKRIHNNIILRAEHYSEQRPTILLNSHIDTVRPVGSYTLDPYTPKVDQGRLYGLGSNDAGASAVTLTQLFLENHRRELPFNLVLALSAEEEISGINGIRAIVEELSDVDCAIVGEPTSMQAAIAERGLVVLDCTAKGQSGHAARDTGINALYVAMDDIAKLRSFKFERTSPLLGDIRMTATQIQAGTQHNIIPDSCHFVVDIRTTDAYTNEQIVELLSQSLSSEIVPRSTHIRAAVIDKEHPLSRAAKGVGMELFVSPTTSDRTLLPFPSIKIGVGDSERSHTADEFVYIEQLESGIVKFREYFEQLIKIYGNEIMG